MALRAWQIAGGLVLAKHKYNMTIKLSKHVLDILELTASSPDRDLKNKVENIHSGYLNIFHSSASKDELTALASGGCEDKLEILIPASTIDKWHYHVITIDGREIAYIVHIPYVAHELNGNIVLPPTEAEKVITRAWHLDERVVEDEGSDTKLILNRIFLIWKSGEYEKIGEHSRKAIYSLLHVSEQESESTCDAGWWDRTTFNLRGGCLLLTGTKTDLILFKSAICETTARWRFLSLYRIFERGYLASILDTLNQEFMQSPASALSTAQKYLENECLQFVAFVRKHNLSDFFEEFSDSLQKLIDTDKNRYAIMLEKTCKEDYFFKILNREPSSKDIKGVLLCYITRCSIVHAGSVSLVFDEFDDANDALRSLVVPMENAVMKYMGIQTI